jgi:hypothetical protein
MKFFLMILGLSSCFQPAKVMAQTKPADFRVIAFYTCREDQAHISFVHEANRWFPKMAAAHHFIYDSTNNWNNLNAEFLKNYRW